MKTNCEFNNTKFFLLFKVIPLTGMADPHYSDMTF